MSAAALPTSILDLPDDELLKLDPALLTPSSASSVADDSVPSAATAASSAAAAEVVDPALAPAGTTPPVDDGVPSVDSTTSTNDDKSVIEGEVIKPTSDDKTSTIPATAAAAAAPAADDKSKAATPATEVKPKEGQPAEEKPAAEAIDYKAAYERLTAPFKANGRDIAVGSVDDAIALMQMGANYNKKMAALKPNLRIMKLLETNGLLSEEKLGFLIDVSKKNPEAISKLIEDSGLEAYDLNKDKASAYRPGTYTVDDKEIELDTVLDEIQDSPAYTRTLQVIGNKWDSASKQTIANHPQLVKVINDHVQRGIYDIITAEIERERMFGRLQGISDIEAYRQVGDAIQQRGGFAHLTPATGPSGSSAAPAAAAPTPVVAPPAKVVDEEKLREKRRAASATQPASAATPSTKDYNPLALSDEDFGKLVQPQYL